MQQLPNELILLIFDNINDINDKRNFIRTCKSYHIITKQKMSKHKFVITKEYYTLGGRNTKFWCICDTLINARVCINQFLKYKKVKTYTIIKKKDYYYLSCSGCNSFIIEETIMNEIKK